MTSETKLRTLLGFASKAGDLVAGTAGVERAIKKRQVYLVICAADLSPKTLKNFEYFCQTNGIKFFAYGTRMELGNWIGLPERGIIGITSRQFASVIQGLFTDRGDSP